MSKTVCQIINMMEINGITHKELSKRTGIAERCISRWFLGQVTPTITSIEKMCDALGAEIKLFEKENKK